MTKSWDRQTGETEERYERFRLYLYMGPDRTVAAAYDFATRLAKGAAHGQLSSWRRAARRYQWTERAVDFDAELGRKALAGDERLMMVAELLQQVYGVLRHADLPTLSKEEARHLLPTFRLFFRDLLRIHESQAAQFFTTSEGASKGDGSKTSAELRVDDFVTFLRENGGWHSLLADIDRVTNAPTTEAASRPKAGGAERASWQPLRDVLAELYPDEASARRLAAQALLNSTRIRFSPRAVDSWHAILTEASHAGAMEQVITAVQDEYGTNADLGKAIRRYRQSLRASPKRTPTGDVGQSEQSKKSKVRRKE